MKKLLLASLVFASQAQALPIIVETTDHSYWYGGCVVTETVLQQRGTLATFIASCKSVVSAPQLPTWEPSVGFPFESRLAINSDEPWVECELIDYSDGPYGGLLVMECRDFVPPPVDPRGRKQ